MNARFALKKTWLVLLALVFLTGVAGCAGYNYEGGVIISAEKPHPRKEKRVCPGPRHAWVPGHWEHAGPERWRWVPGHCIPPGHQKKHW